MKKITEIYRDYKIMPNLAMHQMRAASVAWQICDSLDIEIDRDSIIKACIIHDMGNVIKFNLSHFPQFCEPEGMEYWQNVKCDYILKYGNSEHIASALIAKELGMSDRIIELINCIDSASVEIIAMEDDFQKKICMYSDNRVAPYGIVSAQERSLEAKERYKDHPRAFDDEKREFFMGNINLMEKQIFSHTKIKPEDINDSSVKIYLEKIVDLSI